MQVPSLAAHPMLSTIWVMQMLGSPINHVQTWLMCGTTSKDATKEVQAQIVTVAVRRRGKKQLCGISENI